LDVVVAGIVIVAFVVFDANKGGNGKCLENYNVFDEINCYVLNQTIKIRAI
jgi:hypothetical protein